PDTRKAKAPQTTSPSNISLSLYLSVSVAQTDRPQRRFSEWRSTARWYVALCSRSVVPVPNCRCWTSSEIRLGLANEYSEAIWCRVPGGK
ncbi:hypothetical protein BIW11_07186, partial [Tropilaelaps mercedesae]